MCIVTIIVLSLLDEIGFSRQFVISLYPSNFATVIGKKRKRAEYRCVRTCAE